MIFRFLRDTKGATAIEYGLIAALICVVIVGSFVALGSGMEDTFTYIKNSVSAVL